MKTHRGSRVIPFVATGALALLAASPAAAQAPTPTAKRKATVSRAVRPSISVPLREVTPLGPREGVTPHEAHPVRKLPPLPATRAPLTRDPALPMAAPTAPPAVTTPVSFDGIGDQFEGAGTGHPRYSVVVAPPDTTGAAGDTQYVQWVNTAFGIFQKDTGKIVYGPADGQTLWKGFGGRCETENDGDPVVLYDRMAKRWVMTQFAVTGGPPYFQCVAVSRTSDATGAYARYAYEFSDFNDYPKFGVWPDGYYATFNMFTETDFLGTKACAFERSKMLTGAPARMICFDVARQDGGGGMLPSDLDGARVPPSKSPNYFVNFGRDRLNLWKFKVNWSNPSSSSFTGPVQIPVAAFEPICSDGSSCIPQPGSSGSLDALGDRLMYRLPYRNFGTHQSLLANHSVLTEPGTGTSGLRWYELRKVGSAAPEVHQQGTYSPDAASRWIGSIAMDKAGNIALGYSVSSKTVAPSVRFTGRSAGDPAGSLAAEMSLVDGSGEQRLNRWGDYSDLSLDPKDDCTFWFTTEYLPETGKFNWKTRIAHFKFTGCQ